MKIIYDVFMLAVVANAFREIDVFSYIIFVAAAVYFVIRVSRFIENK